MGSDVTSKVKAPHALTRTESLGRIEVSPHVVATIVGHAANECYGVVGMAARGLRDRMRRERTDALNVVLGELPAGDRRRLEAALPVLESLAELVRERRR